MRKINCVKYEWNFLYTFWGKYFTWSIREISNMEYEWNILHETWRKATKHNWVHSSTFIRHTHQKFLHISTSYNQKEIIISAPPLCSPRNGDHFLCSALLTRLIFYQQSCSSLQSNLVLNTGEHHGARLHYLLQNHGSPVATSYNTSY